MQWGPVRIEVATPIKFLLDQILDVGVELETLERKVDALVLKVDTLQR